MHDSLLAWWRHRKRVGIQTADYEWLKKVAVGTLRQPGLDTVSMLKLERALYMLDKRTPQIAWPAYSTELAWQAELCPGCQALRQERRASGCANAGQGVAPVW